MPYYVIYMFRMNGMQHCTCFRGLMYGWNDCQETNYSMVEHIHQARAIKIET